MSTYKDLKEMFDEVKNALKKSVVISSINRAFNNYSADNCNYFTDNRAYSNYSAESLSNIFFFCYDTKNQFQSVFCEHGNYYPKCPKFRYTKNNSHTTQIYCNTCIEYINNHSCYQIDNDDNGCYSIDIEDDGCYSIDIEDDARYPIDNEDDRCYPFENEDYYEDYYEVTSDNESYYDVISDNEDNH